MMSSSLSPSRELLKGTLVALFSVPSFVCPDGSDVAVCTSCTTKAEKSWMFFPSESLNCRAALIVDGSFSSELTISFRMEGRWSGYLAKIFLEAYEKSELEERIKLLEKRLNEAKI